MEQQIDIPLVIARSEGIPAVGCGPLMGLAEAVGWIAMRDGHYVDRLRAYRHRELANAAWDGGHEATLWEYIFSDANTHGHLNYASAEFELFAATQTGRIIGMGRMSGSNWKDIDKKEWISAQIIYIETADTLAPFASEMGVSGPLWESVCFYRDHVLKLWPPQEALQDIPASRAAPRYRRSDLLRAGPTGPAPAKWVPLLLAYFDSLMRPDRPGIDGKTLDEMQREFSNICRGKGLNPPSRSRIGEYRERYRDSDCLDSLPELRFGNTG